MTKEKELELTAKAFSLKLKRYDEESTFQAKSELERMDRSLTRLYEAGCLSLKDFKRLDQMIFNRMIKLV
jgi:hypothetical protein